MENVTNYLLLNETGHRIVKRFTSEEERLMWVSQMHLFHKEKCPNYLFCTEHTTYHKES